MRNVSWILLMLMLSASCAATAWCAEADTEEQVYAIQNRIFHRDHELALSSGYIADDDFYHVYPLGLSYTFHFNEHYSWEVARGQYMYNQEKDIKSDLENNFGVTPENFPEPKYMLHSSLLFKPLYGKGAILNRGIINHETYVLAGGGIAHYEWKYSTGETKTENAPSICLGVGMKYFLSENWCANIEIRDFVNFREDSTENNVFFGISIGYRFNLSPRKKEEDPSMRKLKKILDQNE